jgi:hypothetical protein
MSAVEWTQWETREIELALYGVYHQVATEHGLHGMGLQWRLAHAKGCEVIAGDVRGAILYGLGSIVSARVRQIRCDEQHAQWLGTEAGACVYGARAADGIPEVLERITQARRSLAEFERLVLKVERMPLHTLPVDHAAIAERARDASAAATPAALQSMIDPDLASVAHWPRAFPSNDNGTRH